MSFVDTEKLKIGFVHSERLERKSFMNSNAHKFRLAGVVIIAVIVGTVIYNRYSKEAEAAKPEQVATASAPIAANVVPAAVVEAQKIDGPVEPIVLTPPPVKPPVAVVTVPPKKPLSEGSAAKRKVYKKPDVKTETPAPTPAVKPAVVTINTLNTTPVPASAATSDDPLARFEKKLEEFEKKLDKVEASKGN